MLLISFADSPVREAATKTTFQHPPDFEQFTAWGLADDLRNPLKASHQRGKRQATKFGFGAQGMNIVMLVTHGNNSSHRNT